MDTSSPVRVRIAPSPTGNLHVGTARTALFNYLYAKRHHGQFILRVEDTDRERSKPEFVQNIYDGLHALGLYWDEGPDVGGDYGPYNQSERTEIHKAWAERLINEGKAYYCYLSSEELDAEREEAQKAGRPYVHSGKCRDPQVQAEMAKDPSRKPSVRFIIPDNRGAVVMQDHVRGEVSFDSVLIGDFVILKSDGTASYNFAVVVDDILMKISHIIRGEDHISNTPKQILLYEAFGEPLPQFAHVGMILAPDKTKLSKRYGATAVAEFIAQGYFPEAFCNFIALLGWSPPDNQEVGTLDHFASIFSFDRLAQSPAVFETAKLDFLNGKLLREMPLEALFERAKPFLTAFDLGQYPHDTVLQILDAVREPLIKLNELPEAMSYFFGQKVILDAQFVGEVLTGPEQAQVLQAFLTEFIPQDIWHSPETIAVAVKAFTDQMKPIKTKTVMWTIRGAVTGRTHGADLSKTLHILGNDVVQARIETVIALTSGSTVNA